MDVREKCESVFGGLWWSVLAQLSLLPGEVRLRSARSAHPEDSEEPSERFN